MQGRYIPAIIMLVAGLVASIICFVKKTAINKSLMTILVVLVIFLILGHIARKVIIKTLNERTEEAEPNDGEGDTKENPEHENDEVLES